MLSFQIKKGAFKLKIKRKNIFIVTIWIPACKLSRKSDIIKKEKPLVFLLHISRIKTNEHIA